MEDTVETVAERLAQLEKTVAAGFFEISQQFKGTDGRFNSIDARFNSIDARFSKIDAHFNSIDAHFSKIDVHFNKIDARFSKIDARFNAMEMRLDALDNKIEISVESLRSDLKTVLDAVVAFTDEMRRTTSTLRKEHAADREILKLALQDHSIRLQDLEEWQRTS